MQPRHIVLSSRDAARNLATEEILLRTLPPAHPGLFLLWRNDPAVIVGRHQCAPDEVDTARAEAENIPILRRITGGGAVCHDAGTLCFSWISHDPDGAGPVFARCLTPVMAALAEVGVRARLTGRNDLEAGGRKFSGSAQTRVNGKVLCHGTLLVRADLSRLGRLLTPDAAKQRAHGVPSVRARVCNIADIWTPDATMEALEAALLRHCAPEAEPPDAATDAMAALLAERKYRCREWNLDAVSAGARALRRRFPWGSVGLRFTVRRGRIAAARISGDFFSDDGVDALERRLEGCLAEAAAVRAALADMPWDRLMAGCEAAVMLDFFAAALSTRR